ncbi:hypothetical protein DES53_101739 [Roseimicrobium gellanilyticum]|uniref:Uncharacterized protein n=1 Tax=Roseimicrobium gellanilyticum TaxID=748857 RepID=A0A366HW61_9BACT|nr:hypothetical protein DES53_101739 [Roseimicrobium gellanilyticum]
MATELGYPVSMLAQLTARNGMARSNSFIRLLVFSESGRIPKLAGKRIFNVKPAADVVAG